jgi:hypothetical protein
VSTEPEGNEEELVDETSSDETQDEKEETQETENTEEETEEEVVEEEEEEEKPLSRAEQRIKEALAERDAYKRMAEARSQREEKEEPLPEMDPEVETAVNARLNRAQQLHQRQLGQIVEQLDEAKFDSFLEKSRVPTKSIASIQETVQEYREAKGSRGIYFTRQEAFELLKGSGKINLPAPGKKVSVVKSKPKFGTERKTSVNTKVSSKKSFEKLTLEEKEKSLDGKTF